MTQDTTTPPGQSPGAGIAAATSESGRVGRSGRHHHHSRRRHHSLRKLAAVGALTVLGSCVFVALTLYLFHTLARNSADSSPQRAALVDSESELRAAREELKRVNSEMEALVKQRLPNLRRMEFDKVIPINQGYVRNILFTEKHLENKVQFAYMIVLENVDAPPVIPKTRVLLFDRTGIQVGGAAVSATKIMRPGDRDSASVEIDMFIDDAKPEYFLIDHKNG